MIFPDVKSQLARERILSGVWSAESTPKGVHFLSLEPEPLSPPKEILQMGWSEGP